MQIELRGVRVHNLKGIDLDLPYNELIALCGPSGSGKSSLAMDTLYAEGQRRYIESFSSYTRQFLEKLEKPDAQRIDGIPPAIAVTARPQGMVSRSTVGTATETIEYLRLLFSRIGRIACRCCGRPVRIDTPESIWLELQSLLSSEMPEYRVRIAFAPPREVFDMEYEDFLAHWKKLGFVRVLRNGTMFRLDDPGGGLSSGDYEAIRTECGWTRSLGESLSNGNGSEQPEFAELDPDVEEPVDPVPPFEGDLPAEAHLSAGSPEEDGADDDPDAETKATGGFFLGEEEEHRAHDAAVERERAGHAGPVPKSYPLLFIVDNLVIGKTEPGRITDSLETALTHGGGKCVVIRGEGKGEKGEGVSNAQSSGSSFPSPFSLLPSFLAFSDRLSCEDCGIDYPALEPRLFSFNSPLGACPTCEGFGNLVTFDLDLIVPHKGRTIKDGAIAPWNSPSYRSKLDELLRIAPAIDLPVDVPFSKLTPAQRTLLLYGNEAAVAALSKSIRGRRKSKKKDDVVGEPAGASESANADGRTDYEVPPVWPGLIAFFEKLQKQKYKMHIRVFLSRWRSYRPCPDCGGTRLRPESLAVRIGGEGRREKGEVVPENNAGPDHSTLPSPRNIADLSSMRITDLLAFVRGLELTDWQKSVARTSLEQVISRLAFLEEVGLGYLTLDRTMRTLSGGEQRRIGLTSALGSSLVDMLYVLDEPSIGLHPSDTRRLLGSITKLRDRGNTVVVVEHEESILRAADRIIEMGPEAGQGGGHVVFQGGMDDMLADSASLTGAYLSGRRGGATPAERRPSDHGALELFGASGRYLKNLDVVFPMGVLCLVTGVSGAGKSTLVHDTLYPALCGKLGKESGLRGLPFQKILGTGQIDDVVMVDQGPIGRSPRSNPVTYLKIFDDIRGVFAETRDAQARNFTAGYFSFNVDGGRCETCKGDGFIAIDMQFMADMYIRCPQCGGKRYQKEILEITYRGRTIADVLEMTAREAFGFFRGQTKVQQKLKRLIDVGLDYVRLGQPANTLSGGESQRLKLAAYLSHVKRGRCLFLLDEPTTGLHFVDVVQLLDCFDALLRTGHSLIVVEHNLQLMRAADYLIDLGPGAAEEGGRIVARGTPEEVANNPDSATGRFLAGVL